MNQNWHVDVFRQGLSSTVWNGKDLTMRSGVSVFMSKHQNMLRCQSNTIRWKLTIFTVKDHQGLKAISDHIWGGSHQPTWRSTSKYTTCNFLLPEGGTIPITQSFHIDVFRPGLLSRLWHFVGGSLDSWLNRISNLLNNGSNPCTVITN